MMMKVQGGVQGYDDDGKMGKAYPNLYIYNRIDHDVQTTSKLCGRACQTLAGHFGEIEIDCPVFGWSILIVLYQMPACQSVVWVWA